MSVPLSQMFTVASYVVKQKLRGRKRYPLVLMLEPLFRCNLACAGCGKIQYPAQVLKKHLSVEQCVKAVEECGTPMVSIPGGEPLMYPEIDRLVGLPRDRRGREREGEKSDEGRAFGSHAGPILMVLARPREPA
jgi:MoaA/NifB/PqqE/SkfB family radical SAM enzyme